jgi:hypothetical protein
LRSRKEEGNWKRRVAENIVGLEEVRMSADVTASIPPNAGLRQVQCTTDAILRPLEELQLSAGVSDGMLRSQLSQPRHKAGTVYIKYVKEYLALHLEYTRKDAHNMPSYEAAMRRQEGKLEKWLYEEEDGEEVEVNAVQDDALEPVEAPKPVHLDPTIETYSRLNQIMHSSFSTSSCTSNWF